MSEPTLRIQSDGLAVERRGRSARVAAGVAVVALGIFTAAAWRFFGAGPPTADALWTLLAALFVGLGGATVVLRHRFNPPRSAAAHERSRGELSVGREGLTVHSRRANRAYGPGSVVDGWIDDAGEVVSVVLRMRGGDVISIEAPTLKEARAVLRSAGVGADQQVLRMRLANAMSQVPVGGCIAALGSFALPIVAIIAGIAIVSAPAGDTARGTAVLILAMATMVFTLLVRALIPRQVVIGTDGIAVERILGRTFVPHARITDVVSTGGAVVLQIRGGRPLWLPTGSRYASARTRADESPHSALLNRIEEARAAGRAGSSRGARAVDLDRAGRTLDGWREHLRGLTSGASYRRPAVVNDEIASVLEDAGAPPERRIAAALALAPIGDPAVRLRIEGVVRACADDRLRVALQAAVDDELTEAELSPILRRKVL